MREPVRADRATGVFASSFAFTVFLIFLLFAVQLSFGLYVRTTTTAVLSDIAHEAATEGSSIASPGGTDRWRVEAERRLGVYADRSDVTVGLADDDHDGRADAVAVSVNGDLPTLLPARWLPGTPGTFTRTVRARIETFGESP